MPLREIERRVLKLLAANRSPDSFVAGATVIHRAPNSPRYSRDVDLFHDTAESVARCAQMDIDVLRAHGYEVNWLLNQPTFQRVDVAFERERLRLEWAFDSAFRFFPIESDEELGYRLNFWDAATNKALALASRSEVRDLVDALYLDANHLALGALAWAAAGKDQGLNPLFILGTGNSGLKTKQNYETSGCLLFDVRTCPAIGARGSRRRQVCEWSRSGSSPSRGISRCATADREERTRSKSVGATERHPGLHGR